MSYKQQLEPLTEQNQILQSHVHPPEWKNPEPSGRYHLVVIGAGTAGLVTAAGAAGLGAKVALVERGLMGGDCLNVGCVPSKALISSARCIAAIRDAGEYGVQAGNVDVDFSEVMERMRRLRARISPNDSAKRFQELGVDVYFGQGQFNGKNQVEVTGDSGARTLDYKRAVIATGARAAKLPVPGLEEAGYLTNESLFSLTALPEKLVVIGGGPIGCEMAQTFARFGSKVTQIDRGNHILSKERPESSRQVQEAMEKDGIEFIFNANLVRVDSNGKRKQVIYEQNGKEHQIAFDEILVSTGRTPNCDGLNMEAAGIEYDTQTGVQVDDRLETTNSRVYAAGDICSRYQFTHAADFMARTVIQNTLFMGRAKMSQLLIPWCTYTSPEIAHVGTTPEESLSNGKKLKIYKQPLKDVDRAILEGEDDGFVEIYCEENSDQIVGATIVASHAGELINQITQAMQYKIGLGKIASVIHPYPTQAEAIRKLGDQYNRTRLTPFVKKLFHCWLKLTR
ncbi:Mercuric reductase [Polystyrenella longa]|uniref:Mercuric reductase n=1 Tax=Polystyrenella longa TaxID=2528007 RepID=A0A518CSS9_9PLAN|nr:mercuric reductase [Polystyrenella longa]QDU82291.1 Mercuric reductase [Polystyrenella longa]